MINLKEWIRKKAEAIYDELYLHPAWVGYTDIAAKYYPQYNFATVDKIGVELGWMQVEEQEGELARVTKECLVKLEESREG